MATVYKPSGALGSTPVLAPLITILGALVLSAIYAYIAVWSPVAGYINLVFAGVFGAGLAYLVQQAGALSKCRNSKLMYLIGAFTGIVALYAAWGFFVFALFSRYMDTFEASVIDVLTSPAAIWEIMGSINEDGWYTVFNVTPSGTLLWVFWAAEALVIVSGGLAGGLISTAGEAFCERCNLWCDDSEHSPLLQIPESGMPVGLSACDLTTLESFSTVLDEEQGHFQIAVKQCNQCELLTTAQLVLVAFSTDDEGKRSSERTDIGDLYVMTPDETRALRELAAREPEASPLLASSTEPEMV